VNNKLPLHLLLLMSKIRSIFVAFQALIKDCKVNHLTLIRVEETKIMIPRGFLFSRILKSTVSALLVVRLIFYRDNSLVLKTKAVLKYIQGEIIYLKSKKRNLSLRNNKKNQKTINMNNEITLSDSKIFSYTFNCINNNNY
jgi:hypothetical protein